MKYVVRQGDNLFRVAALTLGDVRAWQIVATRNGIAAENASMAPDPGTVLEIPSVDELDPKLVNLRKVKWWQENSHLILDPDRLQVGAVYTAPTLADEPTDQPTSLQFSSIGEIGMTIDWTAAAGGADGYLVLMRADSAVASEPSDGVTYTEGNTIGSSTVVHSGSAVSKILSGLDPNTTYHFAVFSYNGTGSQRNYKTDTPLTGNQATDPVAEPANNPTNLQFANTDTDSTDVSWTASTGSPTPDGYIVVMKAGSAPTTDPSDGTVYNVDEALGDGTVKFVGVGTNFTASGLSSGTEYSFKVYAYRGSGPDINYKQTAPLSGSETTTSSVVPLRWTASESDYGVAAHSTRFDFGTNDFSFGMSFKLASTPASFMFLMDCSDGVDRWLIYWTDTQKLRAVIRIDNTNYITSPDITLSNPTTAWHTAVVNVDRDGNATLKVDDTTTALISISSASANAINANDSLWIAERDDDIGGGNHADMWTRSIWVMKGALATAQEITDYEVDPADVPAGITNHWAHTDGSGTTLTDTVNADNITINGGSWDPGA